MDHKLLKYELLKKNNFILFVNMLNQYINVRCFLLHKYKSIETLAENLKQELKSHEYANRNFLTKSFICSNVNVYLLCYDQLLLYRY